MAQGGYKVMDSDMRVMEPPDLWQRYIEPRFRMLPANCAVTPDAAFHCLCSRSTPNCRR